MNVAQVQPLVRRQLGPDEWSETYLADLVRRHGVRQPWKNHLDQIRGALPATASAGHWREEPSTEPNERVLRADGIPRYGGHLPPAWSVSDRAGRIRYCPMCISEQRIICARWRITALSVCTLHGCWLKDDLVEPAVTGSYSDPGRMRLAEATTEKLLAGAHCPLAGHEVVRATWGSFERKATESTDPSGNQALAQQLACAMLLWRLLTGMATVHRRQVAKRRKVCLIEDVGEVVRALGLCVDPSVDGIARTFRQITSKTYLLAAERVIAHTIEEEAKTKSLLSLLPLRSLHEAAVAADPALEIPTKPGALVFREEKQSYYSRNEALERLGIAEPALSAWVRRGVIKDVITRQLGRKPFVFLSRTEVDRLSRELNRLVPVEQFISEVSIDWSAYFALRRGGLLNPIILGDVRHLMRPNVTATQLAFENAAKPAERHDAGAMPLFSEQCVKAAGGQGAFVDLLKAVLGGRVALARDLSRPGWSSFLLPTESLAALAHARRSSWTRRFKPALVEQASLFEEAPCLL
ncbi:hypothetical protein NYO99_12005 [Pelomonas sp. UHG3]|uniref:Uncharacterized protein n=1 Tax=Roseateles hydrophilus TaxID=2975054 RepID=A0ACC6CBD1_9BURK|nr:hypothetical protein [Pelomonas sp. UHG3]MCY4745697.1 hypothetical protein [Pelomonas sp. UHG3]